MFTKAELHRIVREHIGPRNKLISVRQVDGDTVEITFEWRRQAHPYAGEPGRVDTQLVGVYDPNWKEA